MSRRFFLRRLWIAIQALAALVMLHACALLFYIQRPPEEQLSAMGWVFLSLGVFGAVFGLLARHWVGSPILAWSGAVKLFGSIVLFALSSGHTRVVYVSIAMVILVAGLIHMLGALRLQRMDQKYLPFVASGTINVLVSVIALSGAQDRVDVYAVPLVAGSAFTTGMTLFYYGRFLRQMAATNASVMQQLRSLEVPRTRHSRVKI